VDVLKNTLFLVEYSRPV